MLTDFRKLLDALAVRAGWKSGEIRSTIVRHTPTAPRGSKPWTKGRR
jgi:hypothetical protein